jgi:DNA polymerase (family 10)
VSGESPGPSRSKAEIARRLREAGELLRLQGESPYRAGAYESGADALDAFEGDLGAAVEAGRLTDLRGIGPSLAQTISDLWRTGTSASLEKITGAIPPALRALALARVPGLTWRRLRALHVELGISTTEELRAALASGVVQSIKGLGPKTVTRMQEALADAPAPPADQPPAGQRMVLLDALAIERRLLPRLRRLPGVEAAEVAGELRRRCETIGELAFALSARHPAQALHAAAADSLALSVDAMGEGACRLRLYDGTAVTIHAATPERFGAGLIAATGSPAHVARLAARAQAAGVVLADLPGDSEAAVYARLALPFIPPELREDQGELEAAKAGDRFADLIAPEDIRGLVHCHTTHSDGRDTVLGMAQAADALGMAYLTITDHSPTAAYARGVTADGLAAQWQEIAAAQSQVEVALLRGTESDILRDGNLDYPGELLRSLDVVVASIHERYRMGPADMTERIVRAIQQPVFKIWGHPLGRLLLRRDPIACDVERILDVAAASPAAIEINGSPYRLDLPPEWVRAARRRGLKFVISTDAHSTAELANLGFGVAMARRAGVRRSEVLNSYPLEEFRAAVRP